MSASDELEIWQRINRTTSVKRLIDELEDIGPIEISGDRGAYDMASRVKRVAGGEPDNLLTRNYGIRQQYLYLIKGVSS
jgi:hypothetical protein